MAGLVLAVVAVSAGQVWGQRVPRIGPEGDQGGGSGRGGVGWGGRAFDFEERAAGNFDELPRFWYVIGRDPLVGDPNFLRQPLHRGLSGREGYRRHAVVRLDDGVFHGDAAAGQSLRVMPDGGDAGAYLQVGAASAVAGATYEVICHVRTQGLVHAGARVTAYYIDEAGERIDASVQQSDPIRTQGGWQVVRLRLTGYSKEGVAAAAWIGIELTVHQPDEAALVGVGVGMGVGRRPRDVTGEAWFDDVSIGRVADAEVSTQRRVGVLRGSDRPRLMAVAGDVFPASGGGRVQATLRVTDLNGAVVDEAERLLGGARTLRWVHEPRLPAYGWYRATLTVRDAGVAAGEGEPPLVEATCSLVWLPPREDAAVRADGGPRLGVSLGMGDDAAEAHLPDLLRETGLDAATLPLLPRESERDIEARSAALDRLLMGTGGAGAEVTLALPVELDGIEPGNGGVVEGLMSRLGGQVGRWQLDGDGTGTGTGGGVPAGRWDGLGKVLGTYVRRPRLVVSLPLNAAAASPASTRGVDDVVLRMGPEVDAGLMEQGLGRWKAAGAMDRVTLQFDDTRGDDATSAGPLLLRLLAAWEAEPGAVLLDRPWALEPDRTAAAGVLQPSASLAVLANAGERLRGRRVVGRLPLGEGLVGLVLAGGEREGALVAWNEGLPEGEGVVRLHLGGAAVAVDPWGNRADVRTIQAPAAANGATRPLPLQELSLTRTPVFIEGIDTELAELRAGLRVDEPFIPAVRRPHERVLTLRNPWAVPLVGDLRLSGPGGWRASPVVTRVKIPAGGTLTLPIELTPPPSPTTGEIMLRVEMGFTTEREYAVELQTPLRVGLEGLRFEARLVDDGAGGLAVEAEVWNVGDRPRAVKLFAVLPGRARQERLVPRVEPGEAAVRRFVFAGLTPGELASGLLRTGVTETDGPGSLSQRVAGPAR